MEYLGSIGDNHQTNKWEFPHDQLRGNIEEPIKRNVSKNANRIYPPVERRSKQLAPTTKEPKDGQCSLFGMVPTNLPERPTFNMGRERHFRCGIAFNYEVPRRGKCGTTCRNRAVGLRRALPKQFNTRKTRVPSFNPNQGAGTVPTIAGTNTRDRKSESQI